MRTLNQLLMVIIMFHFSCTKTKEDNKSKSIPNKDTVIKDSEMIINVKINYAGSPIINSVDINNDQIDDISINGKFNKLQYYQEESFETRPLHSGIEIATKDSIYYVSKDSIICDITTDTLVFYSIKMCQQTDPKMYLTKEVRFANVSKTNNGLKFTSFDTPLLVYELYTSSRYGLPCNSSSITSTFYGNAIGIEDFLYFKIDGKLYGLKISRAMPYITFQSIVSF